ncbi:hypothetical protein GCM10022226_09390 [Sphaerisporangium flaviroseum]|uniref:Uncharacterized protein n=1 Tax=Sphaerisporangium flaviroseum TaxID=509199 RepID=A0ABP7HME8_9ACTN
MALVMELAVQDEIAHQIGYSDREMPGREPAPSPLLRCEGSDTGTSGDHPPSGRRMGEALKIQLERSETHFGGDGTDKALARAGLFNRGVIGMSHPLNPGV